MRLTFLAWAVLAMFSSLVGADELSSMVSLVLGEAMPSNGKGVDPSTFTWCTDQASFVASIMTSNYPTIGPRQVQAVVNGMCTASSCTNVGFTRLDKCCPIALSEYTVVTGTGPLATGTRAAECLSSLQGDGSGGGGGGGGAQPASTSATATRGSSSGTGKSAAPSSSSPGGASSATPPPSSATSAASSPSATSASSNMGWSSQVTDLYSGSALALLVALAAYIL